MSFVHLRLHTQYSMLEGAIRTDDLFDRVKSLGMPAVAMTDTSNMFGAIDFHGNASKAGIKPIIGCEINYVPQGRLPLTGGGPKAFKLILLSKDFKGYQNLCEIVTRAYTEAPVPQKGQPVGPKAVVDRELLEKYAEGLIVLAGCIRGEIPYLLHTGDEKAAGDALHWFKKRWGEDFYLELVDSGVPEQADVNSALYALGERNGVKCVATTNCHYLDAKESEAHEVLMCIEQGRNLDIDRPRSLVPSEYYLKSSELMRERFEQYPGVCDETLAIAAKCNLVFPFKDAKGRTIYQLPNFRP